MKLILLICLLFLYSLEAKFSLEKMKQEKRVAFVIDNNNYTELNKNKSLYQKNEMNTFLSKNGFETVYLKNATRKQMIIGLRKFRDVLQKDSIALFYYSGYAVQIEKVNYLLPVDTFKNTKNALNMKIDLEAILHVMDRFSNRKNIIIIDNIDNKEIRKRLKVTEPGLAKIKRPKNTDLIVRSKTDSLNLSQRISPCIQKSFSKNTYSNKKYFESFKSKNSRACVQLSSGDFYFRLPKTLNPVVVTISKDDALWKKTVKANTIKAYKFYLSRFPLGKNISKAQHNINKCLVQIEVQKKIDIALMEKKIEALRKQEKERKILAAKLAEELRLSLFNEPQMVSIPAGNYKMGCNTCANENERPLHYVSIKNAFKIGKYEVTNKEYNSYLVSIKQEKTQKDDDLPAVNVSWKDAIAYAKWLSKSSGKVYTLPSEAQWEYVNRATSKTKYSWGTKGGDFFKHGWGKDNSNLSAKRVGQKEANKWGVYDLSGNVSEWCSDNYRLDYTQKSRNTYQKVVRGGSYLSVTPDLRTSFRFFKTEESKTDDIGFRLVIN